MTEEEEIAAFNDMVDRVIRRAYGEDVDVDVILRKLVPKHAFNSLVYKNPSPWLAKEGK